MWKRLISLPFYPTSTTDQQWLCAYNSFDLLEQVDIEELKRSEILLLEKRDQLVKILENLKENDNPVIMVATLKYRLSIKSPIKAYAPDKYVWDS